MNPEPLVVIVGPTGSGKSDLAMQIAQKYNGELICADSRTVYKYMDIGTAKPSTIAQKTVIHHLLDVVEPGEPFTAADFKRCANKAIADIYARKKLPIMVGGSGLYIDAVIFDYQFGQPVNPVLRAKLTKMNVHELQRICSFKGIEIPENSLNKRHLIRAIELGGLPKRTTYLRSNTIVVGIEIKREVLKEEIARRAELMIKQGILHEICFLAARYGWENEAMTGNIYRIFKNVVDGTISQKEALERVVHSDMGLAKRQMTWLKRNPYIVWDTPSNLFKYIASYLYDTK